MQHEILFKAIALDSKQWVEGSYHKVVGKTTIQERTISPPFKINREVDLDYHVILIPRLPSDMGWNLSDTFTSKRVIPETVCQYSGYEALDDTKIFEGDIIDDLGLNRGDVELSPDSGWVVNTSHATLPLSQSHKDSLVTGNIHDHHTTSK